MTERMLAYVQTSMDALVAHGLDMPIILRAYCRLERIETYLIRRFNRGVFS